MQSLTRLNHYFIRYWRLYVPGLIFTIISAIFAIAVPVVVRQAIDSIPRFATLYSQFEATALQHSLYWNFFWTLLIFALIIIGLSLASGLFTFLMRQTVVVASRHIEFDLRNTLYEHLQKLSMRFYNHIKTGDVITRATSDIEQVRRYIGPAIMYSTRALVIVIASITAMLIISPTLTLYALMPLSLLAAAIFIVAQLVHKRSEALQRQYAQLTSRVQETLAGIRLVKAYAREETETQAFENESRIYKLRMLGLARVEAAWRPVFLIVVGLSEVMVVWVGGRLVAEGLITIGNIAEYIIYVALMTWPVAAFGLVISMMQRASASAERIYEILDHVPDISDDDRSNHSIMKINGHVRFERVSFRYEDDLPLALQNITFTLPAGQSLAIVGRTGSGKTTLIDLLSRLYEPSEGRIIIDGKDIKTLPLSVLREAVGYVPQDVFLFSDSIGNNIAFGTVGASKEDIHQSAHEAELLETVLEFPLGLNSEVGERGVSLSGGQAQRTTIARALIRKPRILVLDDALSSVDTKTENRILEHLRKRQGHHTMILISHRISSIKGADQIIVLDQGQIAEQGTHLSLMKQDGLYAQMYQRQLLKERLESFN
ncbi:MAG: ABC transporter ATP-binding protein [Bacteroidetes bacterium]|nr:ABC transporter ATP-binding protein [Bacteroidota bacterium]